MTPVVPAGGSVKLVGDQHPYIAPLDPYKIFGGLLVLPYRPTEFWVKCPSTPPHKKILGSYMQNPYEPPKKPRSEDDDYEFDPNMVYREAFGWIILLLVVFYYFDALFRLLKEIINV